MAKIKKLYRQNQLIYPATITPAVKDPETGQTLPEILKEREERTYPKMSVGFAENIVGDGTATEEEFSFRPTAGVNRNVETTTYDYDMRSNFGARIKSVKGNSVVWNQMVTNGNFSDGLNYWSNYSLIYSFTDNISHLTKTIDTPIGNGYIQPSNSARPVYTQNHQYLARCLFKSSYSGGSIRVGNNLKYQSITSTGALQAVDFMFTHTSATQPSIPLYFFIAPGETLTEDVTVALHYYVLHDLTRMFGAGNEPTTVEEFYARLPKNVDLNAYNDGEMVDGNYGAIKTTGFNQWDEQSIEGIYNTSNGVLVQQSDCLSSKNPIKVVGGCPYVITAPNYTGYQRVVFFDEQMNVIGNSIFREFTTPQNCRYINFSLNTYGSIYNGDVCVHLAWDEYASLNGTYAPYKPFERDLSWVSQYFPNGMRRAGSVSDEIRFNSTTQKWEAVQRIGVVDLGTLSWGYASNLLCFYTTIDTIASPTTNMLSSHFVNYPSGVTSSATDDNIMSCHGNNICRFRDTAYGEDAAAFTTAMSGVMLNYELATPIVTEIEGIPNLDYDVADYGTEELIVAEGVKSAPFHADIIYTPNALKTLEQVPDILRRLAALENATTNK